MQRAKNDGFFMLVQLRIYSREAMMPKPLRTRYNFVLDAAGKMRDLTDATGYTPWMLTKKF
jgi:hypothetical protein